MPKPTAKLAIIAGSGEAPIRLVRDCLSQDIVPFVIVIRDQADAADFAHVDHVVSRLGAIASSFDAIIARGIGQICLIGRVRRPSLIELRPDLATAKFLAGVGFTRLGDNALLGAIGAELERRGLTLVAAHDILRHSQLDTGALGQLSPPDDAWSDITLGWQVAEGIGRLDIGQAVVIQQGLVLAVEAAEGTDAMLERAGQIRRDGAGGVLIKLPKPQQDIRIDCPTIGPRTVQLCAQAGLRGMVLKAGAAQVIDVAETARLADRDGIFIFGWQGPTQQPAPQ